MLTPNQPVPGTSADKKADSARLFSPSVLKWAVVLLPLAYLWFRLINNLRLEWTTNPQYGYGLLVPFLCLGLLLRRWHAVQNEGLKITDNGLPREAETGERRPESRNEKPEMLKTETLKEESRNEFQPSAFSLHPSTSPWSVIFLFGLLAFLYLPTRLIEAATPEWRPIQWLLGIEAIGLTLCVIRLGKGRSWLRQLAFPICIFFVAIPWPTLIEQPIIQTLTRASAAIVVELLGWVDVPAMVHGNVIEVSTGMVGIDEACSGIRSFQSSLMISLFLGEFYRLSPRRRWLLVPMGFVFSMALNVCRMSLLTLIAAKKGVDAISKYHDQAGITTAIFCTLALWGVALLMRNAKSEFRRQNLEAGSQKRTSAFSLQPSAFKRSVVGGLAIALLVWLCIVEAGVQTWYRSRESHLKLGPEWSLNFPLDNPTLRDVPMDATTRGLLRFDEGKQATWNEADGTQWEGYYFSWLPGRVAGYLAKRHTPEICLTATGLKLISGPKLTMMNVHGVELPIRSYVFETGSGVIQVFHCRWEAGVENDAYVEHESARYNLVRAIWAGRGNKGQKVLEIIVSGIDDPEQAEQALARQLEKLIKVEGAGKG